MNKDKYIEIFKTMYHYPYSMYANSGSFTGGHKRYKFN